MDEEAYLNRLQELWQKNWPEHLRIDPVYPLGEILITESVSYTHLTLPTILRE